MILLLALACGAKRAPPAPLVQDPVQVHLVALTEDKAALAVSNRGRGPATVDSVQCEALLDGTSLGLCPETRFALPPDGAHDVALPAPGASGDYMVTGTVTCWSSPSRVSVLCPRVRARFAFRGRLSSALQPASTMNSRP